MSPAPERPLPRSPSSPPALAPLALLLLVGCGEDWCLRFNLDCASIETTDRPAPVDRDGDVWGEGDDCDDLDPTAYPGAEELCDGVDNDCDGEVDEGTSGMQRSYPDADQDGYGSPDGWVDSCEPPVPGRVANGDDCDDTNPLVRPGAFERCNDVDDDCDEVVDDVEDGPWWFPDADGDGFGDRDATPVASCEPIDGHVQVAQGTDCDDADPAVRPGAEEVCDALDNDCDDLADDADPDLRVATTGRWFRDADGDGHGDPDDWVRACAAPAGFVESDDDCDPAAPETRPGADELCDGADNDCDDVVDEEPVDPATFYADADGDGYGDPLVTVAACAPPAGAVANALDCDDTSDRHHPGAAEADCDDPEDYNCDGSAGPVDADGDGWLACEDCDDADAGVSPGAAEVCDPADVDEDCDGLADDLDPGVDRAGAPVYWPDADGDGFGDDANGGAAFCDDPSTAALAYVTTDGDCDDAEPAVSPAAVEVCDDGLDNDCDGGPGACAVEGDRSLADADLLLVGEVAGDRAGWSVAGLGDVDGDGLADVAVGAPDRDPAALTDAGRAYLLLGGSALSGAGGSLSLADAVVSGVDDRAWAGAAVAGPGDVDGDGFSDLLVGSPGDGAIATGAGLAALLLGPVTGASTTRDAAGVVYGTEAFEEMGGRVAGAGDVDGDGLADVLLGRNRWSGTDAGAYLFLGPLSGARFSSAGDARLAPDDPTATGATSLVGAGDMDGDGFGEVVVGQPGAARGAVVVFRGPVRGDLDFGDADAALLGEAAGDAAGLSLAGAGDVDGDGLADLLVGATGEGTAGAGAGAAYLVLGGGALGPSAGPGASLSAADLKLTGEAAGDAAGQSVALGDVDGDGLADLLVGAHLADGMVAGAGVAYLVAGPGSGTLSLSSATARLLGVSTGEAAGVSVAVAGDVDGNGLSDVLVGAAQPGGGGAGRAYLVESFAW